MAALAEVEREALPVPEFEVKEIPRTHPALRSLLRAYLKKFDLPLDTEPGNAQFYAVAKAGKVCCVFGLSPRNGGGIEGTDFYAAPNRDGVRAMYMVLTFFNMALESGAIPYGTVAAFAKNIPMRKRFERVFGVDGPVSVVYAKKGKVSE